ncbi:MAG TPA: cofactor-independent phosphoglycerate mutase [Methylomirabilota bacterium]|jgi:2,3-bisphosphoglycerate-independent phosphoglycerate mutase|nr:cofactor-independent phosphoglycerate mutase [Methylomirabilota bacterium]
MKYVILQGDGMADWPVAELGNKTPLAYAHTPNMDRIASQGILGLTHTIPEGFPAGSDVGTMSLLGYDPRRYHTGRSPIEAASMGVELGPEDIAFRCNLVTLGVGDDGQEIMVDFAADHITSEEAAELIKTIHAELGGDDIAFYPGVSYRHLMVWRGGKEKMRTTPPHDITGQAIAGYLPEGDGAARLRALMDHSRALLAAHPVNTQRQAQGHKPASSIWLWGQGRRPALPTIKQQFGLDGSVISAVDLVRGIGVLAGLEVINVPGATGFLDTNYLGKGQYGVAALRHKDFLFLHVEATDEAGHMGSAAEKVKALENFDEKVVGTMLAGLQEFPHWRVLLMPDHATPVALKTHSPDPVPFAILSSDDVKSARHRPVSYNENSAQSTGLIIPEAWTIMEKFIRGEALIS